MLSIEIQILGKWFPTEVPVLSTEHPDKADLGEWGLRENLLANFKAQLRIACDFI